MKKFFILAAPVLFVFASCSKGVNNEVRPNTATTASTQGSIIVKCDDCKIDYGMPDQYHGFSVVGVSPSSSYTYKSGYTLQSNIYAQDHTQNITYTVYDANGKIVYQDTNLQTVEGSFNANVLLP